MSVMRIRLNTMGAWAGISLMETVIAMLIVAVTIVATINGYVLATNRAEWSAYSLAANSLALQRLEQVRGAAWNLTGEIPVDQLVAANFPVRESVLDLPQTGSNSVIAVVTTTISTVSANPAVKSVRVDCVWPFRDRGIFTNTVVTYRSPEQ
jgi:Tfp pilus assembly protein PilV